MCVYVSEKLGVGVYSMMELGTHQILAVPSRVSQPQQWLPHLQQMYTFLKDIH